jgi:large exoprotein involved in heme utilization and adhesion
LGSGGYIEVGSSATLSLTVRDAAQISADTAGAATEGYLRLQGSTVRIQGGSSLAARTSGSGTGGDLEILGSDISLADSTASAASTGLNAGDAGGLSIGLAAGSTRTADVVNLTGSRIESQSSGLGAAGVIQIDGRQITLTATRIDTDASEVTGGIAGYIFLGSASTAALTLQTGSQVLSRTAGATTQGRIDLMADRLNITGGSLVDASTSGEGKAGNVTLTAKTLILADSLVSSSALDTATADAGKVTLRVSGAVNLRESKLLAFNDADFAENTSDASGVDLQAGSLLMDGSQVLADARGGANGGSVTLNIAGATTLLNNSRVGTSAVFGDGGPVSLVSAGPLLLRNSQINTSVEGKDYGSGGDISVQAPTIVMRSAFIQANTVAERFKGGDVRITTGLLLPDGSNLRLGGSAVEAFKPGSPAGLNVIQAAAPDGVSGQLNVTQPELNVAAALASLQAPKLGLGRLAYDLCEIPGQSSLSVLTRGALYPYSAAPMSPLGAGR